MHCAVAVVITHGEKVLFGHRITSVGDERVDLTPSEFLLLTTLMSTPGRTFSRLELLDRLQDTAYEEWRVLNSNGTV